MGPRAWGDSFFGLPACLAVHLPSVLSRFPLADLELCVVRRAVFVRGACLYSYGLGRIWAASGSDLPRATVHARPSVPTSCAAIVENDARHRKSVIREKQIAAHHSAESIR